jgi:hypothetical protein
MKNLRQEICELINRHRRENHSNTPDFILSDYLIDCLRAFERAINCRDHIRCNTPPPCDNPPPPVDWQAVATYLASALSAVPGANISPEPPRDLFTMPLPAWIFWLRLRQEGLRQFTAAGGHVIIPTPEPPPVSSGSSEFYATQAYIDRNDLP